MNETPMPETISAAKLSALTGLTDKRHRQLAAEGFFPAPVEGEYEMVPAIRGLFRHYKEWVHRRGADIAKDDKTRLETELLRMKIEETRGRLLPREDVEYVIGNAVDQARQVLWQDSSIPEATRRRFLRTLSGIRVTAAIKGIAAAATEEQNQGEAGAA